MKWLIRLLPVVVLLLASAGISLWLVSPWLITKLVEKATADKGIAVRIEKPGRPTLTSAGFETLEVTNIPETTPNKEASPAAYSLRFSGGKLEYRFPSYNIFRAVFSLLTGTAVPVSLDLFADSLHAELNEAGIKFIDRSPLISVTGELSSSGNNNFSFQPDSFTYIVNEADIKKEQLSLEGIDYAISLSGEEKWSQKAEKLLVRHLLTNGSAAPVSNFKAAIAITPKTFSSENIVFTNCSVDLLTWKASTDSIVYNTSSKETSFTLQLEKLKLEDIPGFKRKDKPYGTGTVSGEIPLTFRDTTITIANAVIRSEPGAKLIYYSAEGSPLAHVNLAGRGKETVKQLSAVINLRGPMNALQGIALNDVSCTFLGGHVSAKKIYYDLNKKQSHFTIRIHNIPLHNTLKLLGDFSGSFNAPLSGTVPFLISRKGFSIKNAHLFSAGKGEIKHTPKEKPNIEEKDMFSSDTKPVLYLFSSPDMRINRTVSGATDIMLMLKSFERKKGSGSYNLDNLKGTLTLGQDPSKPDVILLEDFTASIFGGTVAVDNVAYNFKENCADFILSVERIPIQELINLQGLKKVTTSGTLSGKIPIKMNGPLFEVHQGAMNAEEDGRIIYNASEEEIAIAHESLKTTYSALSDFHYNELQASMDIEPDGESIIQLRLKGFNPSFQEGRPVHLNLNVEQNLLDLLRSFTISTNIEEAISEKTLQKQLKKSQ